MIDPWAKKSSLRWFLFKFKEENELDLLIKNYISEILDHHRLLSPSKGPYGEQGKDLTFCENKSSLEYCSYVIKSGSLQKNLDGNFGILKQMRDALFIKLPDEQYNNKKRTVIVIYNGEEGYRGAIDRFEKEKKILENKIGNLLLRPIERWDIDVIVNKLYPHREKLKKIEEVKNIIDSLFKCKELVFNFYDNYKRIDNKNSKQIISKKLELSEKLFDSIETINDNYPLKYKKINI